MNSFLPFPGIVDLPQVPEWFVPATGAALTAAVVVLVGVSFARRRQPTPKPKPAARPTMLMNLPREDAARNGTGEERRRSPRRCGNPTTVLVNDPRKPGKPEQGLIVDRSEGGLCLLFGRKVAPGSRLGVRVTNAPPQVAWVEVTIRYCKPIGERWHLGCQFVERPPMLVLLMFG